MQKILEMYRKAVDWLASFGVDRWIHKSAGAFFTMLMAVIGALIFWGTGVGGALYMLKWAWVASAVVGFIKEVLDAILARDVQRFDFVDFLFTLWGGVEAQVFLWFLIMALA